MVKVDELYTNAETERLDGLYDIKKYTGPVLGSLGASEVEETVGILLKISALQGKIVGVNTIDLRRLVEQNGCSGSLGTLGEDGPPVDTIDSLLMRSYVKLCENKGVAIAIPTQGLLDNQCVPKKTQSVQ